MKKILSITLFVVLLAISTQAYAGTGTLRNTLENIADFTAIPGKLETP
ncbi:MAG: hypothetical protein H0Z24_03155 [Thermosipho sp. (in: Bacteria)]|nr:hypothetical protein [Thermosipho sp. (in: thermotogales)]